ncbi:unnamed protein product [Nippostrongylus brasiliensis]|uniref:CCHC-type domain-containing protein n=1 Tax=Nippostrongylus brasiliensis TaxID=27835 RepID=A0A0N4XP27_NIPBR|nr:unnamed protein product [Nippostrongylus brasiliensis]
MSKTKNNKERQSEKTKSDLRKEISRIEDRLAEIRAMLNSATLPFRVFTKYSRMREEESYLRCAFCHAKGEHYSDSCPKFRTVQERKERVRCRFCLDVLHSSRQCKSKPKMCTHCPSYDHHTALCERPEERGKLQKEYDDLSRQLKALYVEHNDM